MGKSTRGKYSDTLNKIVSTFLFKDPDCNMKSKKKYTYIFIDLLDAKDAFIQSNLFKLNIEKHIIVRLLKSGREKILKRQYNELIDYFPGAITIVPHEVYGANGLMEESAIWNIADLIWYQLFSGYKDLKELV